MAITPTRACFRAPAAPQEPLGEVAALAELWQAQLDRAGAGVPVARAVAVAGARALGADLSISGSAEGLGLCGHRLQQMSLQQRAQGVGASLLALERSRARKGSCCGVPAKSGHLLRLVGLDLRRIPRWPRYVPAAARGSGRIPRAWTLLKRGAAEAIRLGYPKPMFACPKTATWRSSRWPTAPRHPPEPWMSNQFQLSVAVFQQEVANAGAQSTATVPVRLPRLTAYAAAGGGTCVRAPNWCSRFARMRASVLPQACSCSETINQCRDLQTWQTVKAPVCGGGLLVLPPDISRTDIRAFSRLMLGPTPLVASCRWSLPPRASAVDAAAIQPAQSTDRAAGGAPYSPPVNRSSIDVYFQACSCAGRVFSRSRG